MIAKCGILVDMTGPNRGQAGPPVPYQEKLFGTNEDGVRALLTTQRTIPQETDYQPNEAAVFSFAGDVVRNYNALSTDMQLSFLTDGTDPGEPTCVRWEWIDEEWVAIYNWELSEGDGVAAAGKYHVSISCIMQGYLGEA